MPTTRNPRSGNSVNDAQDIAAQLKTFGFEVILKTNADKKTMLYAIDDFERKIRNADTAMFYFSGHGLQVNGRNYLLPLGSHIKTESDIEIECVDAYRILGKMESSGERVNLVVLDACRNNPLARMFRGLSRGLARMDAPKGSLIAYSTAPGDVAEDGFGQNSPYTEALKRHMRAPGMNIEIMFKQVRKDVIASTGGRQIPWEATSLIGDFYFVP
jgi:uncharacterized caspase-like protein